ncbi:MAG: tetratricopeptide repeat protein [Steroidobacteraceae bacterium]
MNRVDQLANNLHRAGRAHELESELRRLDYSGLSPSEQEAWWHAYGICALQAGGEQEALHRFTEAYAKFPDSSSIRFSLGQQYIRTGQANPGFELFRTCVFPQISSQFTLAQARYAYLFDRYPDGFLFLRPLFDAYRQLRVLDDHFLYVRGLPFFGTAWAYLAAFSMLSGDFAELESVTRYVVQDCHDYDLEQVQAQLKACRDAALDDLLHCRQTRLARLSANFPMGYARIAIAVIQARQASSFEEAQRILREVPLTAQDFPWLEDVRTLTLAAVAHHFAIEATERSQREAFLERQPLLFEPDHAVNFLLLRYQEQLKPSVLRSLTTGPGPEA